MANIENTRSLYLANANPRLLTRASSDVLLSASAPLFKVDAAGTPNTPSITFDAIPISMDSSVTYSFSAVGGTLTGVAGRSATLLFTNMSAETATVTVTATYRGTTYIRSTKVAKLVDIDPSDIEVDLSPENLKDILEGQITESELFGDLRDRIDLIDADVFTGGSVAARVKAETDSRILAVKAETDARVAALTQEASNRTTYVQGYTYSKVQADEAISIKADTITSAYTAYANAQRDVAISTASSDVRTYSYSKSDTNSAIAASATQLRSEFSSNNGASVSWVQEYAYSKSAIDSAEAAQTTSITSAYKSYADTQKTAAITAANADVRQYTYSKAETNGALASQSTDITTAYKSYADTAKGAAITAAAADVRSYSYSKSGTDSAIASTANTLRSEFASNNGASIAWVQNYAFSKADTTSAIASKADELRAEFSSTAGVTASYVQNYTYSKAQADSAIASATSSLSTTVGQHTTTLQTQATSLNGLSAQYTVKIDNNGYVTGYGLASSLVNGTPTSSFIINADRFAVVAPGIAPKVMFAVGNVNGQSTIGINGSTIIDGSLLTRTLAAGSITTDKLLVTGKGGCINDDPYLEDMSSWVLATGLTRVIDTFNTPGAACRNYITAPTYTGAPAQVYETARAYVIDPSSTYRLSASLYAGAGNNRSMFIYIDFFDKDGVVITNTGWGGARSGYVYGGAPPTNTFSRQGGQFGFKVPGRAIPFNARTAKIGVWFQYTGDGAGSFGQSAQDLRLERATDAALIVDGEVTASKILAGSVGTNQLSISQGGAINSGQVGFDNGNGFWIEGVGAGHGARMSMGNSVGKKFLCDPANGILGLYNADIDGLNLNAFTVSIPGGNLAGSGTTSGRTYGSRTIAVSGTFRGPLSYQWYVAGSTTVSGANYTLELTGDTSSNTISVFGSTKGASDTIKATIVCVVTDANGTSKSASFAVSQIHGNLN